MTQCNLTRSPTERWPDALLRVARCAGMEDEARVAYDRLAFGDTDNREAALEALEECGLVELANEMEDGDA